VNERRASLINLTESAGSRVAYAKRADLRSNATRPV